LAEHLLGKYKNEIESFELIPSSGGVFEVTLDGKLIFSKKETGRFPENEEIENFL
jgi:selenoprotein W-related protein